MTESLRIVIADDEKMVREGIVSTMPWESLHLEVVGTAANGRSALQLVREKRPHIVLTDVRMPFMSGLDLILVIKKELPSVKTIILSAYDDFDYVRQALKCGALDYLIKPVQAEELTSLLQRVVSSIHEEIKEGIVLMETRENIRKKLPLYADLLRIGNEEESFNFLKTFLHGLDGKKAHPGRCGSLWLETIAGIIQELHIQGILNDAESEEMVRKHRIDSAQISLPGELETFLRAFNERLIGYAAAKQDRPMPTAIRKVVAYVEKNYSSNITVRRTAEMLQMNPDYFSHLFKSIMGINFIEYVNRYRVDRAEELLSEGNYKVYEVAEEVGFNEYKYFAKLFHRLKGFRPTDVCRLRGAR